MGNIKTESAVESKIVSCQWESEGKYLKDSIIIVSLIKMLPTNSKKTVGSFLEYKTSFFFILFATEKLFLNSSKALVKTELFIFNYSLQLRKKQETGNTQNLIVTLIQLSKYCIQNR